MADFARRFGLDVVRGFVVARRDGSPARADARDPRPAEDVPWCPTARGGNRPGGCRPASWALAATTGAPIVPRGVAARPVASSRLLGPLHGCRCRSPVARGGVRRRSRGRAPTTTAMDARCARGARARGRHRRGGRRSSEPAGEPTRRTLLYHRAARRRPDRVRAAPGRGAAASTRGVPLQSESPVSGYGREAGRGPRGWVHAVSVGEAIRGGAARGGPPPDVSLAAARVTTVTPTGARVVVERFAGVASHRYSRSISRRRAPHAHGHRSGVLHLHGDGALAQHAARARARGSRR